MEKEFSADEIFATIAKYCNLKDHEITQFFDMNAMPCCDGPYNGLFEEIFIPCIKEYIAINTKLDKRGRKYVPAYYPFSGCPEEVTEKYKQMKRMSIEELRQEFNSTLTGRMQNPERLIRGYNDLFHKETFDSIARKRQDKPTDKTNATYRYSEEGNIDDLLTEEEREQILHLSSNLRCMTYGYWRSVNPD
jgi:hypothetical protein